MSITEKQDDFDESEAVNINKTIEFMMKYHKLLTGIGFALLVLGLAAATGGVLALTVGISIVTSKAIIAVGASTGIALCAAGGGTALLGGILAGIGLYGRSEKCKERDTYITNEDDDSDKKENNF